MDIEELKKCRCVLVNQFNECTIDFAKHHIVEVIKQIDELIWGTYGFSETNRK